MLLVLRRRCCLVGFQRSGQCSIGICRSCNSALTHIVLASLTASRCCCRCQHCGGVVALGTRASLPSLRAPHGDVCPSSVIAVRGVLAVSGVVDACPPFSATLCPHSNARAFFDTTLLSERLMAATAISVTAIPQATAGCAFWSSSSNWVTIVVPIGHVIRERGNGRHCHQVESLVFFFPGTVPDPIFHLLAGHTLKFSGAGQRLGPLHRWRKIMEDCVPNFLLRSGGRCHCKKAVCKRWGGGLIPQNTL